MKEKLRIIYLDTDTEYRPYKVLDVIDFGDRFVSYNEKFDYYGGIHLKKDYLHYTIANPEKEQALEEYYKKCDKLEKTRTEILTKVFD
jgi:hypothetical protein